MYARRPKRLLVVVVSALFIFCFPFNVVLLVKSTVLMCLQQPHSPRVQHISWAAFALGCFNRYLNPFLYVFFAVPD